MFELPQPTSCASQRRGVTPVVPRLGSVGEYVRTLVRTCVSIAPGRLLGSQDRDAGTLR